LTPNGFRWTHYCVTTSATALLAVSGSVTAFASRQYTFRYGDTLSSIARAYHVSISDLEQANHLDRTESIRDGKRLVIPAPPKRLSLPDTMRRNARAKGDRLSLRLGPGSDYRRVNFVDAGASLTVTAEKDGWFQVELDNGHTGWLRQDFVAHGSDTAHERKRLASRIKAQVPDHASSGIAARHASHSVAREASERLSAQKSAQTTVAHHAHKSSPHDMKLARAGHGKATHTAHHTEVARAAAHQGERGEGRHHRVVARGHAAEVAARAHNHDGHHEIASHGHKAARTVAAHHANRHPVELARESSSRADDIVHTAYAYRGTPYVYGGAGRGGFDCSGFTSYLYGRKGISLPHSARGQFGMGRHVDRGSLKPGDLVFFHTVTPGISHVGMYVGNGRFVHASSRRSGGVRVDNLDSGYYSSAYRGARRMR
jgi:cell wall-associated NlpC family hydrolase